MPDNPELEEFSRICFEDEADMLEYAYEKIENSVYIWTLWCKAFAPEIPDEDTRAIVQEFMTEIHKDLAARVRAQINVEEAGNVLQSFIKRSRPPKDIDDLHKIEGIPGL